MKRFAYVAHWPAGLMAIIMILTSFYACPAFAGATETGVHGQDISTMQSADNPIIPLRAAAAQYTESAAAKPLEWAASKSRNALAVGDCLATFSIEDDTLDADGLSYARIRLKCLCPGDLWLDVLYGGEVYDDAEKYGGYVQTGEITEDEESGLYYKAPALSPTAELSGTMDLTLRATHQQSGDYKTLPVHIVIGEYVPPVQSEIIISSETPYAEYGESFQAIIQIYKDGSLDSETHTLQVTTEPAAFGFEGDIEVEHGETTINLQAGAKTLQELIDEEMLDDVLTHDRITIRVVENDSGVSASYSVPLGKPLDVFLDPCHDDDRHAVVPADKHFPVKILAVVGGSRDDPGWARGENTKQNREVSIQLKNQISTLSPSGSLNQESGQTISQIFQTNIYGITSDASYYNYHVYGYHDGCAEGVLQCPQTDVVMVKDELTNEEEWAYVSTGLLLQIADIAHAEQPSGVLQTPVAVKSRISSSFYPDLDLAEFSSRFADSEGTNYQYGVKMETNWVNKPEDLGWWGWIKEKVSGADATPYNGICAIGENNTLIAQTEPKINVGGLDLPGVTIGQTGTYFFTIDFTAVDLASGNEMPTESLGNGRYSFGLAISDQNAPYTQFLACALTPDSQKEKILLEIVKRMPVAGGTAAKLATLADIACKIQKDELYDALLSAGAFIAGETLNIIDGSYPTSLSERERNLLEFALNTNQIADYQAFLEAIIPDVRVPQSLPQTDNLPNISFDSFHDLCGAFVQGILGIRAPGKRVLTVFGADAASLVDEFGNQATLVDDIGDDLANLSDAMAVRSGGITAFIFDGDKTYDLSVEGSENAAIRIDAPGAAYILYSYDTDVFTRSSLTIAPDAAAPVRIDYQGDGAADSEAWPVGTSLPSPVLLPDTGQTRCYNNVEEIACPSIGEDFYGQDAHYAGAGRSYSKLGMDGAVLPDSAAQADGWMMTRDNATNLVWGIKTDAAGIQNKDNTYTWYDPDPETNGGDAGLQDGGDCTGSACNTHAYIQALNNQSFGGFSDWRLPTIKELSSLINSGQSFPAIDANWFPSMYYDEEGCASIGGDYCSSTTRVSDPSSIWYLDFSEGDTDSNTKQLHYRVLAVRSGNAAPHELVVNGNGTLTDPNTGLMWQQETPSETLPWQEAVAYADELEFGGCSDWRLPNRNELQSLVDYSRRSPAVVSPLIPYTASNYYWSSTTAESEPGKAWAVGFSSGDDYSIAKTYSQRVRAVRSVLAINPVLTVLPASHNFGDAAVGSSSAIRAFTITNTGGGSLVLGTIDLSGTDASEFAIQSDACSAQSLSASESCGFSVIFSPDSEGAKNATLTMPSNTDPVSVALSGTGVASGGGEPTEVSGDQYDGSGGPWALSGSPYIVTGNVNVPLGRTLTIEPGVTVLFDGNYGIDVFGALTADGTPEAGIRFSSNADTPARGDWKSIYFEPGGGTSIMDHCTVEYGGGDTDWGWANICVDGVSTVTITNTASRYSADVGLHVKGDASPVVTQCDFSHNGYDALAVQINSYPVLSDLLAHDNDRWNGIMVEGGDITASGTWRAAGIPYVINDGGASSGNREIVSGVTLTIMPGTVIKMEDNGTISFYVSGALISEGSADKPIIFTSVADDAYGGDTNADGNAAAAPADWESVDFAPESTESIVTHTMFRFGGQDDYTIGIFTDDILFADNTVSYSGADGIKIAGVSPVLTRVKAHDSVYDGLWLVDSSAEISSCDSSHNGMSGVGMTDGSMPTIHNCILTENGDAGVSARNGSNPAIGGSVISGNADYGVINETTSLCVNAQGNWWGDAAGPLDDSDDESGFYNPDGTGNKVSDHVDYQSWLTAPPGIEAPVLTVLPASHNFGDAAVGSNSAIRAFTITNTGGGSLVLGTIDLSGTDASEFAIQSDACSAQSLSASESCGFSVIFSPDSEGAKNATLTMPSNTDPVSVALSGTGVASGGAPAGDINGDAIVNLQDLVIVLQIIVRMEPQEIHLTADVNGDERIGMEEAVYIARHVAFTGDVSEEDRELAVQKATEAMSIIETGDFAAAREKFAEALEADAGNTAAKAGYSLCVVGENAPAFKNVMAGVFNSFLANDLSSGFDIIMQMLTLFDKFPFYKLSSMQGETTPQSIVPASDAGYGIDIDLDVPNSLKEIVLRITKGVPVTDTSYFAAIATIKSLLNNYVQQMKLILPLIRGAQQDPALQFEISTAVFKDMFGYDIDGDGINDVDIPGDKVCIDQGDFYLLDAVLSMIVGIGDVFAAYNFEGDSFDITGDVNGDGYISPDEYLPPRPYYTLSPGAAEKLTEARDYMTTAVEKANRGIEITLAEAEDYYEILPVNTDQGFRSFLSSLKNSDAYLDLNDLQNVIAGVYAFDLSEGPFFLSGKSIRVDAMRFFDNPKDLRDYLPAIRINDGSMIYQSDSTLGGIIPDGDLDDILNYSIGISTLFSIPIIRSLTPAEPAVHGTVTITGEGFGASQGSSAISLANRPVQGEDILSWSDSEITFRVAEDMLSGRLAVTVDGTRSNSKRLSISGMLVDHFDEVASAEMAGAPPTTIDSGLFVYDIYDMDSAVGSPSEWKINGGFLKEGSDMYRTGGSLDPNSNLARGSNLVMKGRSFSDIALTVGFGVEQGSLTGTDNDGIGVIFRYQDENNFYRLMSVRDEYWDHGPWTRLEKWVDGRLTVLALSTNPEEVYKSVADDAMNTGGINEFRIEATGNQIKAYLRVFQNGAWGAEKLIFDVEDSQFSSGRIGVSTYAMWWALIDYIAIATP